MTKPRVYMAGKIRKNCWRHHLVQDLRRGPTKSDDGVEADHIECFDFTYVGPFFVSCDHGCYHGHGRHGVVGDCSDIDGYGSAQGVVPSRSILQIDAADFVLAWIQASDCHGTLVEIGWAVASRVPVVLGYASPELEREVWFPKSLPHVTHVQASGPKDVLDAGLNGCRMAAASSGRIVVRAGPVRMKG